MKKKFFQKSKITLTLLFLLALMLAVTAITVAATSADLADGRSFTYADMTNPVFVKNHFTEMPRAVEAEINLPAGNSTPAPIFSSDPYSAGCFLAVRISSQGKPNLYFETYVGSQSPKYQSDIVFDYDVRGKGWLRLAIANEIVDGNAVYKLYVNGELVSTVTNKPHVHSYDVEQHQTNTAEFALGSDSRGYFSGNIRNIAVYSEAPDTTYFSNSAINGVPLKNNSKLMAYYDFTSPDNTADSVLDESGNGHHAGRRFFKRSELEDYELRDYSYSFAFVGDTQFLFDADYKNNTTRHATPIYEWLVQNKDSKKIARVFGLGDITELSRQWEWEYAVDLHEMLGNADMPYSIIPGNHEYASTFNEYFKDVESFTKNITGLYREDSVANYYSNFDVMGHKYTVIALEYCPTDEILAWADSIAEKYSDRKVIVITHSYMNSDGELVSPGGEGWLEFGEGSTQNNGSEVWEKFASKHENIVMIVAGHIDPIVIRRLEQTGVNGNTVQSFLIDPQGFDRAVGHETGLVAMFYFSADGSEVQVEYVSTFKTLEAQKTNPAHEDILYHEANQFSFTLDTPTADTVSTLYGEIPVEWNTDGAVSSHPFVIFQNGSFFGAYETWNQVTRAIVDLNLTDSAKSAEVVLRRNYTNTNDAADWGKFNMVQGKLTVDLNGYSITTAKCLFDMTYHPEYTGAVNIFVKNGSLLSGGSPIINNQIRNVDYTQDKVWNITLDGVTLGYAQGIAASANIFYAAWTNGAAESGSISTTNLTLNNCKIDLATNPISGISASNTTLFNLVDNGGLNRINVNLNIQGGEIITGSDTLNNVTLYSVNANDKVALSDVKLITPATQKDSTAHYAKPLPTPDGDMYFVEILDDGVNSTYELQSITVDMAGVKGTINISGDNVKYLSALDYPFVIFYGNGTFSSAKAQLLGSGGTYAIDNAVYGVLNANTWDEAAKKYTGTVNDAYIFMRRDYEMPANESYNNIANAKGKVFIDLQGHTLSTATGRTAPIFSALQKGQNKTFSTDYTVRNGEIRVCNTHVIQFRRGGDAGLSAKNMTWTFSDITFGLIEGATTTTLIASSNTPQLKEDIITIPLTLNGCIFDLRTVEPTNQLTLFNNSCGLGTYIKCVVTVNGGEILTRKLENVTPVYIATGTGSDVVFGKGKNDDYINIVLSKSTDSAILDELAFKATDGKALYIIKKSDAKLTSTYTFTTVPPVVTPYGTIPSQYNDPINYPIAVFQGGKYLASYKTFCNTNSSGASALKAAWEKLINGGSDVQIYLLGDAESTSYFENLGQIQGKVIIDLNGKTLTHKANGTHLLFTQAKGQLGTATFEFKNGNIVLRDHLLRFDSNSAYTGITDSKYKTFDISFTEVKFSYAAAPTSTVNGFLGLFGNHSSVANKLVYSILFTDCEFDLTKVANADFALMNTVDTTPTQTNDIVNVTVNGGNIKGLKPEWQIATVGTNGSSVVFGEGKGGAYTTVTNPANMGAPGGTVMTSAGVSCGFVSSETEGVYVLNVPKAIDTPYGTIPADKTDVSKYPIIVFQGGVFKGAYKIFSRKNNEGESALQKAHTFLNSSSAEVTILLRDNVDSTNIYENLGQAGGSIKVDLAGFTITQTGSDQFLFTQAKNTKDISLSFVNGNIAIVKYLMRFGSNTNYSGVTDTNFKTVSVSFTDIGFSYTNTQIPSNFLGYFGTHNTNGALKLVYDMDFNNCTFDLAGVTSTDFTLFNTVDTTPAQTNDIVNVTVNGGEIKSFKPEWKLNTVGTNGASVVFDNAHNGKYTVITNPKSFAALTADNTVIRDDGVVCVFVEKSSADTVVYGIMPESVVNLSFIPKASVTLDSTLIFNIYLPAHAGLGTVTLNGETVALDEAKNGYYIISTPLTASESAEELKLVVNLTVDGTALKGSFTFSTVKYAEKLLATAGISDAEQTLAKDMLAYINSAYVFFNGESVAKIDAILNGYTSTTTIDKANAKKTVPGLSGATFTLEAKPTVQFFFAEGFDYDDFTFKVGKRTLTGEDVEEQKDGYVKFALFAYEMTETFSYTVGDKSGEYNLIAYYAYASGDGENDYKGEKKAELTDLTVKFYNYCLSAKNYRDSVIGK